MRANLQILPSVVHFFALKVHKRFIPLRHDSRGVKPVGVKGALLSTIQQMRFPFPFSSPQSVIEPERFDDEESGIEL